MPPISAFYDIYGIQLAEWGLTRDPRNVLTQIFGD